MTPTGNELTPDRTFLLLDTITGKYRPERVSYKDAEALAAADGFLTIRRLDETGADR
jgi:hypothetical protein